MVLRTTTVIQFTYNQKIKVYEGGKLTGAEYDGTTTETFEGTDGECNWWLLSMSIKYPLGIASIYESKAKLL